MANQRRFATIALVLPIFGALMIVPPLVGVFNLKLTLGGIPIVAIYLFAVWLGLIGATFVLSHHLRNDEDPPDPPPDEGETR